MNFTNSVTIGGLNRFYCSVYYNDFEIFSDTLTVVGEKSTGVQEGNTGNIPASFGLDQNYPNPFNPSTYLGYRISDFGTVSLTIYDILGNKVTELVNEEKSPGEYKINFNGKNLSSGLYFYQLKSGALTDTKKFVLMK